MTPMYPGYGYPMYSPLQPQQQRLAEMEQQYPQFAQPGQNVAAQNQSMIQPMPQRSNFVKCRAVTSIDEAKASMIDLDGSIHVFTDIGNKKIYTKQINLDGTATLNTYELVEAPTATPVPDEKPSNSIDLSDFVSYTEFETFCRNFGAQIADISEKIKEIDVFIDEEQKSATRAKTAVTKGGTKK